MWPAIIGAVGSILGSVSGGLFGKSSQDSANKANMELAKYKYEKDLEMWNRQNDYNTPAAQMSRYAQAGLNPNLVYDQGNNGNASSAPSFDVPEMKAYTDYGDLGFGKAAGQVLQGYHLANESKRVDSEVELNDAAINEKNANAQSKLQERILTLEKTFEQRLRNGYLDEELRAKVDNLKKDLDEKDSRIEKNYTESDYFMKQGNKVLVEVDNLYKQRKLTEAQTEQAKANIRLIAANIGKINDEAALLQDELKGRLDPEERKRVQDDLNNIEILQKGINALSDLNWKDRERFFKLIIKPLEIHSGMQSKAASAISGVLK